MLKYFSKDSTLTTLSKFVLCITLAGTAHCMTWQTISILDTQKISDLAVAGKKKVTLIIPLEVSADPGSGTSCAMKIYLGGIDYNVITELSAELKKRNIDSSILGVPTNFAYSHIAEGIAINNFSYVQYHQGYSERNYATGEVTTYSDSRSVNRHCKIISDEEYAKYGSDKKADGIYRTKLQNALIDSNANGQVFVKYADLGTITIDFNQTLDKKTDFLLKVNNLTSNEPEITFKVIKVMGRKEMSYPLLRSLLFAFSLGFIPMYNSHTTLISLQAEGMKNRVSREVTTYDIFWTPVLVTFGLFYDKSGEKIEKGKKAAIQELLDDIGLK